MNKFIDKVWVDEERVYARTKDGLTASYLISDWPRLAAGTPEQRQDFYLSYSGIHWPALDEDLSFEGMFNAAGLCDLTDTEDSVCYEPPVRMVADDTILEYK